MNKCGVRYTGILTVYSNILYISCGIKTKRPKLFFDDFWGVELCCSNPLTSPPPTANPPPPEPVDPNPKVGAIGIRVLGNPNKLLPLELRFISKSMSN